MQTYPQQPGFKTSGTSAEAACATAHRTGLLRTIVLQQLRANALTADECAAAMGESVLSVRPRFSELRQLGEIEPTGKRRCNVSGRAANVWHATTLL